MVMKMHLDTHLIQTYDTPTELQLIFAQPIYTYLIANALSLRLSVIGQC